MVIYMTTNLVNGKQYIGKDIKNRSNYLGSGTVLKKAILKNGKENFKKEIIEVCSSHEELIRREEYWLNYYDAANNPLFYNMHNKSYGGTPKENLSAETRRKLSDSHRGENNAFYGKKHSIETKKKLRESLSGEKSHWYGKTHSEETKKKLSEMKMGELNPNFGKPHSKEHNEKISKTLSGRKLSQSHIDKLKISNTGINNPMYGKKISDSHKQKIREGYQRWLETNRKSK